MSRELFLGVEDDFAQVAGSEMKEPRPKFAIVEVKFGLGFVAGGNEDIEAGAL